MPADREGSGTLIDEDFVVSFQMCEECYRLFGVETRTDSRMRFTELSPAFGGAFLMPNQANKKADPPKGTG